MIHILSMRALCQCQQDIDNNENNNPFLSLSLSVSEQNYTQKGQLTDETSRDCPATECEDAQSTTEHVVFIHFCLINSKMWRRKLWTKPDGRIIGADNASFSDVLHITHCLSSSTCATNVTFSNTHARVFGQ